MVRINYLRQAINFTVFVLIQIAFLNKSVLFNQAFAFFYVGFLLFIPFGVSRSFSMIIAFFVGLIIDIFSSTPGIHASACVLTVFIKDYWFLASVGDPEDEINLGFDNVSLWGLLKYALPLIWVHHIMLFIIENGGFISFGSVFIKSTLSALYSLVLIISISYLVAPKTQRK